MSTYPNGGPRPGDHADREGRGTGERRYTTVPAITAHKARDGKRPLTMLTAYDAPGARWADAAGVDMMLVGDSVAMVVHGHEDTLTITVDEIALHVAAVARTRPGALVVGDMPWTSYHVSVEDTVRNAVKLVRAGAGAVKLEGGQKRAAMVRALVDTEIPVMGHLGLTPQSVHTMGGYRVQGRDADSARRLVEDAQALEAAGCFAIVLEGVPGPVAATVTDAVAIPTIGIGAGVGCDGQVLVLHDVLGMGDGHVPRFVRQYAQLAEAAVDALGTWVTDVHHGRFPAEAETYQLPAATAAMADVRTGGPAGVVAGVVAGDRISDEELAELAFLQRLWEQ